MGGIAACCCVAPVFAIKHLYNIFLFCLFLSILSLKKEKSVAIDKSDWMVNDTNFS